MLKFFCPKCDNPFVLDEALEGKKGKCPKCGIKFTIPGHGEEPVLLLGSASGDDLLPEPPTRRPPSRPNLPAVPLRPPTGRVPAALGFQPPDELPIAEAPPAAGPNKALIGVGIAGGIALVLAIGMMLGGGKGGEDDRLAREKDKRAGGETAKTDGPAATTESRPRMSPAEIMEKYANAVVRIQILGENEKFLGHGSGFVVDAAGIVVTNFHVIGQATTLQVKKKDGSQHPVEGVLAFDAKKDFAILKLGSGDWTPVNLGDSDQLGSGSRIVTIGHSMGLDYTVSDGLFSGKVDPGAADDQPLGVQYLQISAPISPGNSGGPLFNEYGEVVGVNTLASVGGVAQNLNFALPINDVKSRLAESNVRPLAEVVAEGRKRSVTELLRDGARLLQEGDRLRAFLVYKAAYEQEPKNAEVVTGYADALNLVGQHHLAREKCEEALALQPGSARAFRALGQSYYATGDQSRAAIALRRSLAADPDDRRALLALALILSGWKRAPETVALADRAFAKPTEDLDLLTLGLVAYARAGERSKAEALLQRFPKGAEYENNVRAGKGYLALESGRAAEAIEHLARAVETEPDDPFLRLALARALQEGEQWDKAIAEYKACLALEESLYPALKGLARLYDRRNLQMEALSLYRACVQFSPTDLEANLRLAEILRDVGHAEESIPFLKTALERSPGYRPCVLALAEAYAAGGQRDKASDMLAPLAKAEPPDVQARLALAEVYLDQGRPKDATELLLSTRAAGELLARKLFLYGRALEAAENFAGAAAALDEAVSLDPERGQYRYLRAALYLRAERRTARGALLAYLDWAANRQEEADRYRMAQQMLDQLR